ncbi:MULTISPECIES: potassium-transporting ATPase subunit C [Mycolicibacterium]|jgi:K+-transporting ATPase ATPase C chain|uniref:Potassium-transporting ATPase KdpC subunit n=2 Tax=Mycolicibacterium TaxID=1866885 RepID=A1TED4_MYCVP|nr:MULTISPECIES: potassium-transporting ATPase subunit C [Mycolicibacterium]ABM15534.1 K+ transporting ATPase, KdpC subunit [Mycolicibacterium vanbaalenii PYR-1]MCV7130911.1 potassium-transporting ATPase subunit C [Mycolicibacterium vanbaalenii PYR-1]MDN4522204.1 potassium-transporting ATPase subunit C [Mycolicibacterium austroafricanum]QRZ05802.1 potassium-transporting ATPase subunit C [Mycolicibacterium austroafricanum]QZT67358.1 potassium-transporting ATPase subunit C [Mycolicibacterium aus
MTRVVRQHWAALRALLFFTVVLGLAYPLLIWLIAQAPFLSDKADGSVVEVDGTPVGSSLIGQLYTDADGNPLPQYFQGRPSAAGDGYDPLATSASNLGPESIVDQPDKPSLLTLVCSRSVAIGELDGVDGTRPYCTGDGVGAVLSVIGPRDAGGNVVHPTKVVSVNEPCATTPTPFVDTYEGVRVECAATGEDYRLGQLVPLRGSASAVPAVPADAVTASGSGLDPHISPAYADLQVDRVARARGMNPDEVRALVAEHTEGRTLGFLGEPRVNVLELNLALDRRG